MNEQRAEKIIEDLLGVAEDYFALYWGGYWSDEDYPKACLAAQRYLADRKKAAEPKPERPRLGAKARLVKPREVSK